MSQIATRRRAAGALALLVAAALALAGCAPGGTASANSSQAPASTNVPSTPVTLTLAHFEVGALASAIDELAAAYEKKHPNVTIKTQFTSFTDYGKRVKLQMSAQNPPDIAEAGQGFTMMGPLVEAKLLRPLDDYAKLYGWQNRFGPGLLDQSRFQPDGKRFGSGDLYGIALGGNMVGVYYNKQILQSVGITPPIKTVDDLTAAMAKVKQAGYLPLELGNSEQWEANHVLSSMLSQYTTQKELTGWIYGNKGATFTAPSFLKGTKALQNWISSGFIDPAANGLSNDDAVSRFASGKAAFFVSGNWVLDQVDKGMPSNAGFMAFPPLKSGAPLRATGATTSPFGISSASKHPDVAANFIDFMSGPQATETLAKAGYLPLIATNKTSSGDALVQQFNDVWEKVLNDDGLTLYLDWATVGMGNALFPALQDMLGGRTTPEALSQTVQSEWASAHAK